MRALEYQGHAKGGVGFYTSPFLFPFVGVDLGSVGGKRGGPTFFIRVMLELRLFTPRTLTTTFLRPIPRDGRATRYGMVRLIFVTMRCGGGDRPSLLFGYLRGFRLVEVSVHGQGDVHHAFFNVGTSESTLCYSSVICDTSLLRVYRHGVAIFLVRASEYSQDKGFLSGYRSLFSMLFVYAVCGVLRDKSPRASTIPYYRFVSPWVLFSASVVLPASGA